MYAVLLCAANPGSEEQHVGQSGVCEIVGAIVRPCGGLRKSECTRCSSSVLRARRAEIDVRESECARPQPIMRLRFACVSTFDVTFLGHQGWLFTSGESRLLVDPLLSPAFGHLGNLGVVYPPRIFSFDELPPVDALLVTHEHEDHFDLPTLARIDRRVPVLLSAHSSRAARQLLEEMGFRVRRVNPGEVVTIGDLELHLFAPDVNDAVMVDEWDVLPFLVKCRRGHGSFLTTVDVEPHARLEEAVRRIAPRPPVRCYTNNVTDLSFATGGKVLRSAPMDTPSLARWTIEHYASLTLSRAEPEAVFMGGGGFAFTGDRAWMNAHVFRADSAAVCAALSAVVPGRMSHALSPGETIVQCGGSVRAVAPHSPFLRTAPRSEWPPRAYVGPSAPMQAYSPATSVRELDDGELEMLGEELNGFAAHLCSRQTFRALMSLDGQELGGLRPTFSLVTLCDQEGGAYVYEYDPASCAFVGVEGVDPVADYIGGLECWASDLLAVFRGELAPSAITFGRARSWNALPARCPIDWGELWLYCHPLRRPDRFLRLYRRLLAQCEGVTPCVRASGADVAYGRAALDS